MHHSYPENILQYYFPLVSFFNTLIQLAWYSQNDFLSLSSLLWEEPLLELFILPGYLTFSLYQCKHHCFYNITSSMVTSCILSPSIRYFSFVLNPMGLRFCIRIHQLVEIQHIFYKDLLSPGTAEWWRQQWTRGTYLHPHKV